MTDTKFISTREVARLLKVNEKMVYSLISEKGLPASKVTGKWLFPKKMVEEWLEVHTLNAPATAAALSSDSGRLLLAGSDDPLLHRTLVLYRRKYPEIIPFFANVGSMGGLRSLRRGLCHIGVCHLLQDDMDEYNFGVAEQELSASPVFINFSKREQGLLLRRGNPKNILSIDDLGREDVTIANRPLGTGTRLLLDYEISRSAIDSSLVKGYQNEVARHLDAGLEVVAGRADAAPAIRAVAGMLELDFLPLRWERFDLLINRGNFFEQGIQRFISLLQEKEFTRQAESFVGYDVSLSGKMLFPDNLTSGEHE